MSLPKPLFIPWLKEQIDSGQYPGVTWVNQEHTKFSIPWKHALRQDSNCDDIRIFKAWAQVSAGSSGNIPGDHSVWKRNFRSALRARGFKLVKDCKNDAANPHKIYMWPDETQSEGEKGDETGCDIESDASPVCNSDISFGDTLYLGEEELFLHGRAQPDLLQQCLAGLNIVDPQPEMPGEAQLLMNTAAGDVPFPVQETSHMHQFPPALGAVGGAGQISPAEGTLALGQYSPLEGAFMGTQQHTPRDDLEPELPVQSTSNDSGCSHFGTHFKVNIYYRGRLVFNQVVENEAGFCLMFRKDHSPMASPLTVLELPKTDSILDHNQAQSTQAILNNLGGLEVRREGGVLLGHRWGESRVYWGLDKHEQGQTSRALSKNNPEPIYFLKDFVSGMMEFIQNHGQSPSYSLYFFLGQQWPDPRNKPWEKKLIMVEVVLTALEKLKMMAVENGASSLQSSMDLQISLEQMMELC